MPHYKGHMQMAAEISLAAKNKTKKHTKKQHSII